MKGLAILFVLISTVAFAGSRKSVMRYNFKFDTIDVSVPKGSCLIVGNVKEGDEDLKGGVISTIKHKFSAVTDAKGNYSLLIPVQKIQLYFFKPHYGEIVTHEYDFKSGHKVELDFFAFEDLIMIEVDKPVVYLYSEKDQNVSIQINAKSDLTFTYPVYENSWDVLVCKEGGIKQLGGSKTFPYLFWEGRQKGLYFNDDEGEVYGDIVKKENITSFLENKLKKIGLNELEATDFITFWAPRMVKYENVLVQFLIDNQYKDKISNMSISPIPDASKRVFMLFSEIDNPKLYTIKSSIDPVGFQRSGLTLVEWGGSEIKLKPQMVENR